MMPTDCPHYQSTGGGISLRCQCLPVVILPAAGAPNNPCAACQSAWTNSQPPDPTDRRTWTPVLLQLAERHGPPARGDKPLSVTPRAKPKYPTNHPDFCFHSIHVIDKVGCCGSRRWQCELFPDPVRLTDCQRCAQFEPHQPTE